jgi:hypothetical protein
VCRKACNQLPRSPRNSSSSLEACSAGHHGDTQRLNDMLLLPVRSSAVLLPGHSTIMDIAKAFALSIIVLKEHFELIPRKLFPPQKRKHLCIAERCLRQHGIDTSLTIRLVSWRIQQTEYAHLLCAQGPAWTSSLLSACLKLQLQSPCHECGL